jgi:hypothetical protein
LKENSKKCAHVYIQKQYFVALILIEESGNIAFSSKKSAIKQSRVDQKLVKSMPI